MNRVVKQIVKRLFHFVGDIAFEKRTKSILSKSGHFQAETTTRGNSGLAIYLWSPQYQVDWIQKDLLMYK